MLDRPQTPPPVDGVLAALREWGANCGPTAIAAALEVPLATVRGAVSNGDTFKGYMGVPDFKAAIPRAGGRIVRSWSKPLEPVDAFYADLLLANAAAETNGEPLVVLIRFCGPWDAIPRAAATYRHAFAYRRCFVEPRTCWAQASHGPGWVCDINNLATTDCAPWVPAYVWRTQSLLDLLPKRGDGNVAIDWMAQVERIEAPA